MPKKNTGSRGEDSAVTYLQKYGCTIITRHYCCRHGELDIIALDNDTLCFVEVKTRHAPVAQDPLVSMTQEKQHRIIAAAQHYLQHSIIDQHYEQLRFDVIPIVLNEASVPIKITWIKDAFTL